MKPSNLRASFIFIVLISFLLIQCTRDKNEKDPVITPGYNLYKILDGKEIRSIIKTSDGGYAGVSWESDYDDFEIVKLDAEFNIVWNKKYGGSSRDYASSIVQTDDGGYVVIGYTYSTDGDISLAKGASDIWACRLDAEGNLVWDKTYGGSADDDLYGEKSLIKTDDGGYIFIGSTDSSDKDVALQHGNGDIWIVKINSVGTIEFEKTFGGSSREWGSAIVETDGNYAFLADVSTNNQNFPESGAWVISIDRSGNLVWQTCMHLWNSGSLVYSETNEIAVVCTQLNNTFLLQIIGTDGVKKKNKTLSFFQLTNPLYPILKDPSIIEASDGGYFVIGNIEAGQRETVIDALLFRVDKNLQLKYSKAYKGNSSETSLCVLPLSENHYLYGFSTKSKDLPDINYSSDLASVLIDLEETITEE